MWSRNAAASGQTSPKKKWVIGITLKLPLHDQLPFSQQAEGSSGLCFALTVLTVTLPCWEVENPELRGLGYPPWRDTGNEL